MQTITPELAALLKSRFQAGADGFRARLELGVPSQYVNHAIGFDAGAESYPGTWQSSGGNPGGYMQTAAGENYGPIYPALPGQYWYSSADAYAESGYIEVKIDYMQGATILQTGTSGGGRGPGSGVPPVVWANNWETDILQAPAGTDGVRFHITGAAYYDNVLLRLVDPPDAAFTSHRLMRASTEKSIDTDADQFEVELDNSDSAIALDAIQPNMPARIFAWYGDVANEVQVFDGLVDRVRPGRHPNTIVVTGRDWMKKLIVQKLLVAAPQDVADPTAVRDSTNFVYLNVEVSVIVADLLDQAFFPADRRVLVPTGVTVAEFLGANDEAFASAISRLADIVGYLSYADEVGDYHFEPNDLSDPRDPEYTFETGVDVLHLQLETDDDQAYTRVRATGPMAVLSDAWEELWQTGVIHNPVGAFYDPALPGDIRVLDSHTKRQYLVQQSDQTILASAYLGASAPYPLGFSGDPANSDRYWVLSAPWAFGFSSTGNKLVLFDKSDNSLVATYALPNGRWSDMKVSAAKVWLTNLDDDKFWAFDRTGTPIAGYGLYGSGVIFPDPTGIAVDGTEITVFYAGHSYVMDESAPTTVIRSIVSAAGMWGGEYDIDTHTELFVVGSGAHRLWKYTVATATDYEVFAEAVNATFEGQLAALSGTSEIRRLPVRMEAVLSLADAQATAEQMLAKVSRFGTTIDVGIIGNPALQKIDKIRIVDPVLDLFNDYQVGTYRAELAGDTGTYLGTLSMKPWTSS